MNPTTIAGTRRQRVTTRSGVELERQYIFLTSETWAKLDSIAATSQRSSSQVLESLVKIVAHVSNQPEKQNDQTRTSSV